MFSLRDSSLPRIHTHTHTVFIHGLTCDAYACTRCVCVTVALRSTVGSVHTYGCNEGIGLRRNCFRLIPIL